ncbi:MAG TPA: hypothetical protein VE621_16850, partial [Bryobacteraceae bacterium]|nr:hypothetical protein [Bryobacteraceae bacterium]
NPFGVRDPNAFVLKTDTKNSVEKVKVRMDNASLASQSVGPPLSTEEMGSIGRQFRDVGKRLVSAVALKKQLVDEDDSVLGPYSLAPRPGLNVTYGQLIQDAFVPEYWKSDQIVVVGADNAVSFKKAPADGQLAANEYTVAEYNFSLFFGIAIMLYEYTLISDDAPIDRYFEGDSNAISPEAKRGMSQFIANTCAACHAGAEFTNSSTRILLGANGEPGEIIERMPNGNCKIGIYDQSFYNLSVRPFTEDAGIGGNDPFNNPLSIARLLTMPPSQVPSQELLTIPYPNIITNPPPQLGERTSVVQGAFKVPSLRNVELTAPYFHSGGHRNLRQVVQFYNRGGDFRETNVEQIDFEIGKLNLTEQAIDDIVAFLKTLTDARVARQKAPFDHPQLFVPNGHSNQVDSDGSLKDIVLEIKAVGRQGGELPDGFLKDLNN